MDACCDAVDASDSQCPACGVTGRWVGAATVRSHDKGVPDGAWSFCSNTSCPAVFFLGRETVNESDVATQVGTKARSKPVPVCFCFAHTLDDIRNDLTANDGESVIQREVRAAVAAGLCACKSLNPSRACCLPQIHGIVRAWVRP